MTAATHHPPLQTMHHTKCLPWMMAQIKALSGGHPVAEVFLISWSFAYLVEGASGFGTPVALASPMLTELGHSPIQTIACCLIMNALATQFGAVGTPIWFGFGGLGLTQDEFQSIGLQVGVAGLSFQWGLGSVGVGFRGFLGSGGFRSVVGVLVCIRAWVGMVSWPDVLWGQASTRCVRILFLRQL